MEVKNIPGSVFRQKHSFTRNDVDSMCLQALRKNNALPDSPGPIDIERFVEKHFDCTIVYKTPGVDVLGFTMFDKKGHVRIVGVNGDLDDGMPAGERRMRATWAHEAGHCLMHAMLFMDVDGQYGMFNDEFLGNQNVDREQSRILCRKADIHSDPTKPRYDGRWWEYQANMAIGSLLLPKKLVFEALKAHMKPTGSMGIEVLPAESRETAATQLAEIFNVNPIVATIRISELYADSDVETGML